MKYVFALVLASLLGLAGPAGAQYVSGALQPAASSAGTLQQQLAATQAELDRLQQETEQIAQQAMVVGGEVAVEVQAELARYGGDATRIPPDEAKKFSEKIKALADQSMPQAAALQAQMLKNTSRIQELSVRAAELNARIAQQEAAQGR